MMIQFLIAVLMATLIWPASTFAFLWSSVLDRSRATDWSDAGVTGGIPKRTNICETILPYGTNGTPLPSATIITAIRNCYINNGGGVVILEEGKFFLSDSLTWGSTSSNATKNVSLRGRGPDMTHVTFKGLSSPADCGLPGLVCPGNVLAGLAACSHAASPNTANWIANYVSGINTIVVDNITNTNGNTPGSLAAGTYITLDTTNTPNSEFGNYAPFYTSDPLHSFLDCSNNPSRCTQEWHKVTNVQQNTPVAGQHTLTIHPPLNFTSWRSDLSPRVWWCGNAAQTATLNGVEDMTIENDVGEDNTGIFRAIVGFSNSHEGWVKNVRFIRSPGSYVLIWNASQIEIRDSYMYTNVHPQFCSNPDGTVTYGIDPIHTSGLKVENNIFHQTCKPMMAQQCTFCVYGHNFAVGTLTRVDNGTFLAQAAAPNHVAATHMLLYEGNDFNGLLQDYGTGHGAGGSYFFAIRNAIYGYQPTDPRNGNPVNSTSPVIINAANRFSSYIANVLGHPTGSSGFVYESFPPSGDPAEAGKIFNVGWTRDGDADDPITYTSLYRWCNFDYVNNAVRADVGEVPSGQFVPAGGCERLPQSAYLFSRPAWWNPKLAFPAIGPDVTGGNDASGHVRNNPAKECYLNIMKGPADGSGPVLTFNANYCYRFETPGIEEDPGGGFISMVR